MGNESITTYSINSGTVNKPTITSGQLVARITAYFDETVDQTYRRSCCKADDEPDMWFKMLKEQLGPADEDDLQLAIQKYNRAMEILAGPPADYTAWANSWHTARTFASSKGLPRPRGPRIWFLATQEALQNIPQATAYLNTLEVVRKDDIKKNTLTLDKVKEGLIEVSRRWPTGTGKTSD